VPQGCRGKDISDFGEAEEQSPPVRSGPGDYWTQEKGSQPERYSEREEDFREAV